MTCSYCEHQFDCQCKLDLHILTHTKEKPFKCTFKNCDREFNRQHHLDQHILTHSSNPKPFKCTICKGSFSTITLLKRHLLCLHSVDLSSTSQAGSSSAEEVRCDRCVLMLKKKSIRNHMRRVHDVWNYKEPTVQIECHIYGFVFNRAQAFASHMRSKSHFQIMNTEQHSSSQPVNDIVSDWVHLQIPQLSVSKNVLIQFWWIIWSTPARHQPFLFMQCCPVKCLVYSNFEVCYNAVHKNAYTSACLTQVFMAVLFLLDSQQCILYEHLNDRIEWGDIFNYLLRNSVQLYQSMYKSISQCLFCYGDIKKSLSVLILYGIWK